MTIIVDAPCQEAYPTQMYNEQTLSNFYLLFHYCHLLQKSYKDDMVSYP